MEIKQIVTLAKSLLRELRNSLFRVEVNNLPETQKVEVVNPQEPQTTVEVSNLIDVRPELKEIVKKIEGIVEKEDSSTEKDEIVKAIKELKTKPIKDLTPEVIKRLDENTKLLSKIVDAKPDYSELVKVLDKEPVDPLEKYSRYNELNARFNEKQLSSLISALKITASGGTTGGTPTQELKNVVKELQDIETDVESINTKQTDGNQKTQLVDSSGDVLELESNGGVPVNIQDQTTEVIDLYMHKNDATVTIATNTAIDDTVIEFEAGHGISSGDTLCLKEGGRYYQGTVLSVATNDVTVDSPLDYAYTTAASAHRASHDLAVDGSSATQTFHISPPTGVKWDIVRVLFHIEDQTAMDTSKFGGIAALTNGVVLRKKDGSYKNLFNVKSNGEFTERAYDVSYATKAPSGFFGLTVRRTFGGQEKNGVVIRLDGDNSEEFQVLIRDDLTGLDHFHCVVQGHVVTN